MTSPEKNAKARGETDNALTKLTTGMDAVLVERLDVILKRNRPATEEVLAMIEWYETMGGAKLIEYIGANPPSPTAIAGLIVAVAEKRRQSGGHARADQYKLATN